MPRTIVLAVLLLFVPLLSGCLVPYCAYPTLAYTPKVKLESVASEVHAFRVDITRANADVDVFSASPGYERLSEIPVTKTDEVPAQVKPSVSYGFVVIGIALNYLTHTSHSVAVRIYRPGYELVEIKSWDGMNKVTWKPAPDLEAQEKTLDALFPLKQLDPGCESAMHRSALLFGLAEYERLATLARSQDQQERLTTKASKLRERVNEQQVRHSVP
jgi:hypothetical protein